MHKIRHASLEQTPSPPERLPRVVPPSAVSNPVSPLKNHPSESNDNMPPLYPSRFEGRSKSEDITDVNPTKIRHPSEQIVNPNATSTSPPHKSSRLINTPYGYNYNNTYNTYTGAARDDRRLWSTNLPSVVSGVAVDSFGDTPQSSNDDLEKHKKHNLKEFWQRRQQRRNSLNPSQESNNYPINNNVSKTVKSVHFVVGKQEDSETSFQPARKRKGIRIFQRHSVNGTASKIDLSETFSRPYEEEDIKMDFPLRRSLSLGWLTNRQSKFVDVVFHMCENHGTEVGKKTLGGRMRRVARRFNLSDMHWISHRHSASSGLSLKSALNYDAAAGGEVTLVSPSLKIQTDEVTPIRSLAPTNLSNSTDPKSHHVGRFVVLKATVSNTNEETPTPTGQDISNLDDTRLDNQLNTMTTSDPPEDHYWTVSGGKGVLLTAPGARRFDESRPASGGSNRSMHTRFRQFFVENLRSSRSRVHSEQQQQSNQGSGGNSLPLSESPNKLKPPTGRIGGAGLPPHAHTITAGTGPAVARALLQSTQLAKDDGAIGTGEPSSGNSGLSSSPKHERYYPSVSLNSVNDSDVSFKYPRKRLSSTHKMVKKLLKIPSQKKQGQDYGELPDPSKLPREIPQSSLEFTQSRLKNAPRRGGFYHTGGTQTGSIQKAEEKETRSEVSEKATTDTIPIDIEYKAKSCWPNYSFIRASCDVIARVLPQDEAKSEELLLSAFSRSISGSSHGSSYHSQGHHHRHHHHHHSAHHDHRSHDANPTTLTRVTENRRYLMFTKASPFRSPYDFMQTRGKGLDESEVYTVLFRHTTCYELMPESAKLVTLDSVLPIGKAFRALCENGIRAAPVWDAETQTFSGLLTINDFLEMLTYCWRRLIGNSAHTSAGNSSSSAIEVDDKITIEELESTSIKKWKEIRAQFTNLRSSGMDQHDTIHEEDENISESESSDDESSCNSSSTSSSSSSRISDTGGGDGDADSNSVASAPSQLGESDTPRAEHSQAHHHRHNNYHSHHLKNQSVRGCNCRRTQGRKCSVRLKHHRMGGLTIIYPEESLYTALRLLAHCKLHRLPVFDDPVCGSGNPLFVLTHRSLLAYLYKKQIDLPRPKYLQTPLKEAGVGTYNNLSLVLPSTKLVDALAFFENERVSVLPVVDSFSNRRLLDIFAKFDVITLILAGKHKKPDMTVQDVLDTCKQIHRGVIPIPEGKNKFDVEICRTTDTIQFALNKLMRTGYHRLIIVDNHINLQVQGVVSISDLLHYMVLRSPRTSANTLDKSSAEADSADAEGVESTAAPDWLFYSEKDPNAVGRKPCIPLVKDLPEPGLNANGVSITAFRPSATNKKQERRSLRVTSGSSVTTGTTTNTTSSRSSSASSTSSSSSNYSSSPESSTSTSTSTSTSSRSRSSSPKATLTTTKPPTSRGNPKRTNAVDNRKEGGSKGSGGKDRMKTPSS
ncbi:hypothetical protein Aperf_G00000063814 [Anoplocephala perfoliata]